MTADQYDDDRPGMIRVHVAQERGQRLADEHTRDELRRIARTEGVDLRMAGGTKVAIATEIVIARNQAGTS